MDFAFASKPKFTGITRPNSFITEEVKNEPMFFRSSPIFCARHGGTLTKTFLSMLEQAGLLSKVVSIDTRSHMLMPGMWPCIPGWHHDDVPRSRPDGQPDYINPAYKSQHALVLFGDEVAPTEFLEGVVLLPEVPTGVVYADWDKRINERLENPLLKLKVVPATFGELIQFSADTFHRGTEAQTHGWRWFARATWDTQIKPANEIRQQVQVYIENPTHPLLPIA